MQRVNASSNQRFANTPRGGFTLIELLVVIFIIIVLVSITVPALSSVRTSARVSETRGVIGGLAAACQAFELDSRNPAGYFAARDMGDPENENSGFSGMQNIMLDLAGGFSVPNPASPNTPPAPTGWSKMGPDPTVDGRWVWVNPDLIGAANATGKQYFTPGAKNWRVINVPENGERWGTVAENKVMPELIDAFGTPILAWNEDTTASKKISSVEKFARANVGLQPTDVARFYRANNFAFLRENVRVGLKAPNQNKSLIGNFLVPSSNSAGIAANLTALLGNPASPVNANDATIALADILPSASRGGVVLHSAGKDGIYLSEDDKGAAVRGGAQELYYGLNFRTNANGQLTDPQGRPTSTDIISGFDDLVQAAGN
jgi:prepilin-type N-terminal cleavage/methylation domain-containing protein